MLSLKYLHLYRNLRANFKSFLDFVDSKYIPKNDVAVLNATIEAGQKVSEQQKAFAKETRTAEEIVNDIKENGKTEIGIEANKDNIER